MLEKFRELKNDILSELPQIEFVIDQVGYAVDWCIEAHDEGKVYHILSTALDVAKYAKEVSERNFYKTHLVIAALIGDIEGVLEDERFSYRYKSSSNVVEKTIRKTTIDPSLTEKRGCFSALSIWLAKLAKEDEDAFVVALYRILHDLKDIVVGLKDVNSKAPITPQDYITVLGYAYVMLNLRMTKSSLLDKTRNVFNEVVTLLNSDVIY